MRSCWDLLSMAGAIDAPPLSNTLSSLSSSKLVRLHFSIQLDTVGVPSHDLKTSKRLTAQCYA